MFCTLGRVGVMLFFFSSRRRHTRWPRDWSSDVCSSDLEALEDVLPADHHHGVDPGLEQRGEGLADLAVAVVLEPVDLDGEVADVAERAQPGDRVVHLAAGLVQDP